MILFAEIRKAIRKPYSIEKVTQKQKNRRMIKSTSLLNIELAKQD